MFKPLTLRSFWLRVFTNRRYCFRRCFLREDGKPHDSGRNVLAYLSKFCYATDHLDTPDETPLGPITGGGSILQGEQLMILREGRRQVFRELQAYLNLSESDIKQLVEDLPDET